MPQTVGKKRSPRREDAIKEATRTIGSFVGLGQPGWWMVHTLPVVHHQHPAMPSACRDQSWPTWCARCATKRDSTDSITTASSEIAAGNGDLSARTESGQCVAGNRSVDGAAHPTVQKTPPMPGARTNWRARRRTWRYGGEVVHEVVGTMGSIEQSSRKIVDIISVIDGIAFQTNIPALNAAVEAARAGDKAVGLPWWPAKCAAWPNAVQQPPGRSDPDRRFRGQSRNRHPAGRARRNHHGRCGPGREERDRHGGRDQRSQQRAKRWYRPGQPGRHADGPGHTAKRSPGGRGLGRSPVAEPAGLALSQVVGKFRVA